MASENIDQRIDLITRRQHFLHSSDRDLFKSLLIEKESPMVVWQTTPTGKPHAGYLTPLAKISDFLRADLQVTINYLDVYGFFVNYIHSMEVVGYRKRYYHFLIVAIFRSLGIPVSKIRFVDESSFVYSKKYAIDNQKLCASMTQQDARDTTEEVAQTKMLSPLLCSVQQTLSEQYLDLDIQYGGMDQFGLFSHAEKFLPKLGYRKRLHLMNDLVTGLDGEKMSSSRPAETKIGFLDDPETVCRKIEGAKCDNGNVVENGLLGLLRDILIPISESRVERLQGGAGSYLELEQDATVDQRPFSSEDSAVGTVFTVASNGVNGDRHYMSYDEVEQDFAAGNVDSKDLKIAVADAFNRLLAPIRSIYAGSEEWQAVDKLAYPDDQ